MQPASTLPPPCIDPASPLIILSAPITPILNSYTIHRLLAASLSLASKFIADAYIPTNRASKVAGVTKTELPRLEIELLKILQWSLRFSLDHVEELAGIIVDYERGIDNEEEENKTIGVRNDLTKRLIVTMLERQDCTGSASPSMTVSSASSACSGDTTLTSRTGSIADDSISDAAKGIYGPGV